MVHPLIDGILITPICPRSLSFRPMLLPPTATVRLEIHQKSKFAGVIAFDSYNPIPLRHHDVIYVRRCSHSLPSIDRTDSTVDWIKDINERLKFNQSLLR